MYAIDTNVLLRYVLADDAPQFEIAQRLISGTQLVLLTDIVLMEAIWTLAGDRYQFSKALLTELIRRLFNEPNICFESSEAVWKALRDYENTTDEGKRAVNFADSLIARKAYIVGCSIDSEFRRTFTFDKAAQALPNMIPAQ